MCALNIRQPYAELILRGIKTNFDEPPSSRGAVIDLDEDRGGALPSGRFVSVG
jgi:hypothetical protein